MNDTRVSVVRLRAAECFGERLLGLMGRRLIPPAEGLMFRGCSAVHTCFMRVCLDLVFVDHSHRVVDLRRAVRPWRIAFSPAAFVVIEFASGTLDRIGLSKGDRFELLSQGMALIHHVGGGRE